MRRGAGKRDGGGLALAVHASTGKEHVAAIRKVLTGAHALLGGPMRELSVAVVGDVRMGKVHEEFLGIAGPTDVITFELDHDARGRVTAGEVVLCIGEARRRARVEGTTVRRELMLYALHGFLHLHGYDDRTAAAYRKMHRKEDEILTRLGVGPVFRTVRGGAGAGGRRRSTGAR